MDPKNGILETNFELSRVGLQLPYTGPNSGPNSGLHSGPNSGPNRGPKNGPKNGPKMFLRANH